jgi:hypothetical protein
MSSVAGLLEGWLDDQPFIVRRGPLTPDDPAPIQARWWEWWTIEVNGMRRGERFRASVTDSELSVVQQARVMLRGGGRPPPNLLRPVE